MIETVLDFLKVTVRSFPDKPAVIFGAESLSFAEFDALTDSLAARLKILGLKPNDLVCLLLNRNASVLVAIFGVLKAGGAYVPVDKEQGIQRIKGIIADSKAAILITSEPLHEELNLHFEGDLMYESEFMNAPVQQINDHLPEVHAEQLAYVIYTSGTTGKPKGVAITHENLMTQVNAYHQLCPVIESDRTLLVASFSFDVSVYEIFTSIIWGSTLYILEKNRITDIPFFIQTLIKHKITITYIPPLVIETFSSYISRNKILLPLRRLIVGVEPIRQNVLEEMRLKMPNGNIYNAYGPTEATVTATMERFEGIKTDREIVSIGKALPGYKLVLLDDQLQQVPDGGSGQIAIAGKGISPGYLNDPLLTEKKFVTGINPAQPDERYYLSGDKAMMLPDGNLEFIGRNDFQVKIKGFRVEIGEVDAAFISVPQVLKVATIVNTLPNQQNELVTYYISESEVPEIKHLLEARLPNYMVPVFIERLEEFPVTLAGKIDREALKKKYLQYKVESQTHQAESEEEVLEWLFRKNLSTTSFNKHSTYYQLGGDSIGAMVLIIDIQEKYGIHVTSDWFSKHPSFNELYKKVLSEIALKQDSGIKPFEHDYPVHADAPKSFPVTSAQKVLYFLHQIEEYRIVYNNFLHIDIPGEFQLEALKKALEYLVEKYDLMRGCMKNVHGNLQWEIQDTLNFDLTIFQINEEEDNLDFEQTKKEWSRINFDLGEAPLWRFYLVELNPEQHSLFCTIHHSIFDGWSAGIFLNTLRLKYYEFLNGSDISTQADLPVASFSDFVQWQTRQLENKAWEHEVVFWSNKFSNLAAPLFDLNHKKPLLSDGRRYKWNIPNNTIDGLKTFSKVHNTTLFVLLFAPYFLALFNKTKKWKGTIASLHANRSITPFDKMIGYFINIVAIQASIKSDLTLKDFVKQLNDTCQTSFQHSNYPFDLLLKRTNIPLSYEENPVFQCFFIFQNWMQSSPTSDFQPASSFIKPIDTDQISEAPSSHSKAETYKKPTHLSFDFSELGSYSAKAVLLMNCSLKEHGMECWLEYPTNLFEKEEIAQMAESYNHYLQIMLKQSQLRLSEMVNLGMIQAETLKHLTDAASFLELPSYITINKSDAFSDDSSIYLANFPLLLQNDSIHQSAVIFAIGLFLSKVFQTKCFKVTVIGTKSNSFREQELIQVLFDLDYHKSIGDQWLSGVAQITAQVNDVAVKSNGYDTKGSGNENLDEEQRKSESPVLIVFDTAINDTYYESSLIFFIDTQSLRLEIKGFDTIETSYFRGRALIKSFYDFLIHSVEKPFPLKQISLLTAENLKEISIQCKAVIHAERTPKDHVIVQFTQCVRQYPDAMAIIDVDEQWSYSQLDSMSSGIANELVKNGRSSDAPVGIMIKRSPLIIASILGVLKAGMPYMPLDEDWPLVRLNAIIAHARPEIILYNGNSNTSFSQFEGKVINPGLLLKETAQSNEVKDYRISDAAYLIFTSGSTGDPKGVVVGHAALAAFTEAAIQRYQISRADRILQFASFTFDAAVEEIFCSLCSGACLVLRNDRMLGSAHDFVAELEKYQVSVLDLPTAFWSQMTLSMMDESIQFPEAVRLVIIGGEKAPMHTVNKWKSVFSDRLQLINTYGPTESTVVVTSCYLSENLMEEDFPLGIPLGETIGFVVDEFLNPLPDGLIGELVVAGPQLAVGYLNDTKTTNNKFVKLVNEAFNGTRVYLTGDRALFNRQKQLVFKGRKDKQVKIRGFRVELGEIDVQVMKFHNVRGAHSKVISFSGSPAIITYVLVQHAKEFDSKSLLGNLKNMLPDYMLPSAIVPLESFPLTTHLKINENALPEPSFEKEAEVSSMPMSGAEYLIAEIFQQVLDIPACHSGSNFFNLGGDSLQVLSCISEIKKQTGLSISIGVFYENPVVDLLANLLVQYQNNLLGGEELLPKDIVCLKRGNSIKSPIFTVFLDAANHHLPQLVEWDQAVYTFIPQGSDGERINRKTVNEMAAHYVSIIEKYFQKHPVKLIGYSFGGLVALEMAVLLTVKKWELEHLILIDTLAPGFWRGLAQPNRRLSERLLAYKQWLAAQITLQLRKSLPLKQRNFYIQYNWNLAARNYHPSTANGSMKLTLIKATKGEFDFPVLGWDHETAYEVTCHVIEGNHHDLVRDRMHLIAGLSAAGIIKRIDL